MPGVRRAALAYAVTGGMLFRQVIREETGCHTTHVIT